MNKIIVLICVFFAACTGTTQQQEAKETGTINERDSVTTLQLNNGNKWKADATTKNNIALLKQIVNDSSTAGTGAMAVKLQARLDSLVSQCTMQGPDHDALHQWLQPVIHSVKELKEKNKDAGEQTEALTTTRSALAKFDNYFE